MLHFASTLPRSNSNGLPARGDSLNATQQKPSAHQIFLTIEDELHDARRVHLDGQEEDLRSALSMVINRVSQLSSLLSEAYRSQADLEVQLNVAKSNLQLVISNNEMLEEALKQDNSGKDVGWRRFSSREGEHRESTRVSEDRAQHATYPSNHEEKSSGSSGGSNPPASAPATDTRFFKFRFSSPTIQPSRPGTPTQPPPLANGAHLTSPSLPSLTAQPNKELEHLTTELKKERAGHEKAKADMAALEAELESLSQALFEEANKMVATERIRRAETEEELKQTRMEKEALRSALRLIEGENTHLRTASGSFAVGSPPIHPSASSANSSPASETSRRSSMVAIKSPPASPVISNSHPREQSDSIPSSSFSPPPEIRKASSSRVTKPEDEDEDTVRDSDLQSEPSLDRYHTPADSPPRSRSPPHFDGHSAVLNDANAYDDDDSTDSPRPRSSIFVPSSWSAAAAAPEISPWVDAVSTK